MITNKRSVGPNPNTTIKRRKASPFDMQKKTAQDDFLFPRIEEPTQTLGSPRPNQLLRQKIHQRLSRYRLAALLAHASTPRQLRAAVNTLSSRPGAASLALLNCLNAALQKSQLVPRLGLWCAAKLLSHVDLDPSYVAVTLSLLGYTDENLAIPDDVAEAFTPLEIANVASACEQVSHGFHVDSQAGLINLAHALVSSDSFLSLLNGLSNNARAHSDYGYVAKSFNGVILKTLVSYLWPAPPVPWRAQERLLETLTRLSRSDNTATWLASAGVVDKLFALVDSGTRVEEALEILERVCFLSTLAREQVTVLPRRTIEGFHRTLFLTEGLSADALSAGLRVILTVFQRSDCDRIVSNCGSVNVFQCLRGIARDYPGTDASTVAMMLVAGIGRTMTVRQLEERTEITPDFDARV